MVSIPSEALSLSITDIFTAKHADWSFIQDVGGLDVSEPEYKSGYGWYLPVRCDVSGLQSITTKPKLVNSGLAAKEVKAMVKDNRIQIWVVYCLVSNDSPNCITKGVFIKGIKEGLYKVEYLNNDGTVVPIRVVEIKLGQAQPRVPADAAEPRVRARI